MERIPVVRIVLNVRKGKIHYKDSFNEIYWVQKTNERYTKVRCRYHRRQSQR